MIEDTLNQIEARIENSEVMKAERKRELARLLATLRTEVAQLSQTHLEQAQTIANFTQVSAHEATRTPKDPRLLELGLEGLSSSVGGFEESHPRLVQIVNAISNTLANLGI